MALSDRRRPWQLGALGFVVDFARTRDGNHVENSFSLAGRLLQCGRKAALQVSVNR
jgi:hypothetical protein